MVMGNYLFSSLGRAEMVVLSHISIQDRRDLRHSAMSS